VEGDEVEKSCDVIYSNDGVTEITSKLIFNVRFIIISLINHNLEKSRNFTSSQLKVMWPLGAKSPQRLVIFENLLQKIIHFRHTSAKIQPKI